MIIVDEKTFNFLMSQTVEPEQAMLNDKYDCKDAIDDDGDRDYMTQKRYHKYPTFTFSLLCDEHMRIRKNGGLFQPLCWSNPPFFCRAATQRWKQAKNKIR